MPAGKVKLGLKGLKSPFHQPQFALQTSATKVESTPDAASADQQAEDTSSKQCAPLFGYQIQPTAPGSNHDQSTSQHRRGYNDSEPASSDYSQQLPYEYSGDPATYVHSQSLPQAPSLPLAYVNSQPLPRVSLQSTYGRHTLRHSQRQPDAQPPQSYPQPFNHAQSQPLPNVHSVPLGFGPQHSQAPSYGSTLLLTHSIQSMGITSSALSSASQYPLISGLSSPTSSGVPSSMLHSQQASTNSAGLASLPASARSHPCYLLKLAILHAKVSCAGQA
jgi:hypothetical protein